MTDTQPLTTDDATDALNTAVKNALAALTERPADEITREAIKSELDAAMSEQYNAILDPLREERDAARERGDEIAVNALESALDAARDTLGQMFAAGYRRLNKALDAVENGTITYQFADDGMLVMVSHKEDRENSRYTFSDPDESGHRDCSCPDKTKNDDFPVCKHEMAWLIYQLHMGGLVSRRDPAVERAAESDAATEGDDAATAEAEIQVAD